MAVYNIFVHDISRPRVAGLTGIGITAGNPVTYIASLAVGRAIGAGIGVCI